MDNLRYALWIGLGIVALLCYEAWQRDYPPPAPPPQVAATLPAAAPVPGSAAPVPVAPTTAAAAPVAQPPAAPVVGRTVTVDTDVIHAQLDTLGADLVLLDLLTYPVVKGGPEPVRLIDAERANWRVTQSGLRAREGAAPDHRALWQVAAERFALAEGSDALRVPFRWARGDGLVVEKVYTFHRGDHRIDLEYRVTNGSAAPWRGDAYLQLAEHHVDIERSLLSPDGYSFSGPAYYDGQRYEKLPVTDLAERPLDRALAGGWVAVLQHYFVTALVPSGEGQSAYYVKPAGAPGEYVAGFVLPEAEVAPGASGGFSATLWIGPKLQEQLEALAPGLELSVDYGMLTIFAKPLFWLLAKLHWLFGNWGWAIIGLTVLIKVLFYKLAETSGRSMAKMRKVAPKLEQLKERYKDDRQKLNQAMLELYRKEQINPVAGCLPVLIQLPVFIALYWVLLESVEMRQAPWLLWIGDLSAKDPFYVLPLLMGVAMWGQMKLNPPPPDPVQAKVMMFMPLLFTGMSMFFPAGLTLYWLVNTAISVAQQWQINRVVEAEGRRSA
jgi:YidC/Oxa1 family membrane protein insertase